MKKITLILSGIFSCLFSFAQTPQLVPGNYQHPPQSIPSYSIGSLGETAGLGGSLIFTVDNQVWITDGSVNGTNLLKEFVVNDTLKPTGLKGMNGSVYFFADDGTHGYELWATDGTVAGTQMVKDINPGTAGSITYLKTTTYSNSELPYRLEMFNGRLYFAADDGIHGRELWSTDGTTQGTTIFDDINTGTADGASAKHIIAAGSKLYFQAYTPVEFNGLFSTDGTVGGTVCFYDSTAGPAFLGNMTPFGNKLIYTVSNISDISGVYISDGTEAGTELLLPWHGLLGDAALLNNKAYFFASPPSTGCNLFETDGTAGGTNVIYNNMNSFSFMYNWPSKQLVTFNNKLIFSAYSGTDRGIWTSDGTTQGTTFVKELIEGQYPLPYHLTAFNNQVYMRACDSSRLNIIWRTDGTTAGTQKMDMPVMNSTELLHPPFFGKYARYPMVSTGNALYYHAEYDSTLGPRIYKLDLFPAEVGNVPQISSIDIYPNPTRGFINIDAENAKSIVIHGIDGKQVYRSDKFNSDKITVDTRNFAAGTYTITTLLSDNTKRHGKFVKQ